MNGKKMMVLALLLTLGSGMGFSETLTNAVQRSVSAAAQGNACSNLKNKNQKSECEKYLKTLQSNEYLEFFRSSGGYVYGDFIVAIKDYKPILAKAAEESVQKYHNYSAYRNAAIVYVADDADTGNSSSTLSKASATKAKDFASKAINSAEAQSVPAPEMYFVRALADIHYYGLIDYGTITSSQANARAHQQVLENNILPDLEKVGKISPYYTPWGWMEFMYDALGRKTDVQRCHEKQSVYGDLGVN